MKFFQSEVVQKELTQMQDLYMEINKMGLMLNLSQKREQLDKMMRLIELQQTMYMRVTLSDDPEAKKLVDQVKNAASMLGMPKEEIGPQFYDKLKENVHKMIKELPEKCCHYSGWLTKLGIILPYPDFKVPKLARLPPTLF